MRDGCLPTVGREASALRGGRRPRRHLHRSRQGRSGVQADPDGDRPRGQRLGDSRRGAIVPGAVGNAKKKASPWVSTSTPPSTAHACSDLHGVRRVPGVGLGPDSWSSRVEPSTSVKRRRDGAGGEVANASASFSSAYATPRRWSVRTRSEPRRRSWLELRPNRLRAAADPRAGPPAVRSPRARASDATERVVARSWSRPSSKARATAQTRRGRARSHRASVSESERTSDSQH